MSWPQVQACAARAGSTVVWPWGAIEQHGPHLPLDTDALFAERVLAAVLADLPADAPIWSLPAQTIGFSPEHQGFAGTLSLPAELMIALVCRVGEQLADAGFRRLVLFNAHGGQIALLEVAARQLRASRPALGVLPVFLWRGADGLGELIPEPERHRGLHAGLAETALMRHLEPQLVGDDPQPDGVGEVTPPPGWSLEGSLPCAWLTSDLSNSGVVGDPRGATAELGAALFERLVEGWQRRLAAVLSSDWPPRASG